MNVQKFELAAIRPNVKREGAKNFKSRPGKVVFTMVVYAENVSEAVKSLRSDIDGSGLIVLQASQVKPNPMTVFNPALGDAMEAAYNRKYA